MSAREALAAIRERAHAIPEPAFRLHSGEMTQDIALAFGRSAADVPALAEALEAVLGLHRRIQDGIGGPDLHTGAWTPTYGCAECSAEDVRVFWPCATVRAIETALEGR